MSREGDEAPEMSICRSSTSEVRRQKNRRNSIKLLAWHHIAPVLGVFSSFTYFTFKWNYERAKLKQLYECRRVCNVWWSWQGQSHHWDAEMFQGRAPSSSTQWAVGHFGLWCEETTWMINHFRMFDWQPKHLLNIYSSSSQKRDEQPGNKTDFK